MPGHEYFTPREAAIRDIMKPIERAKNVAFAFVLAAWIPAGLRMYEALSNRQIVPTPIVDYFVPRKAEERLREFEETLRERLGDFVYSRSSFEGGDARELSDRAFARWRLHNERDSEIGNHSLGEAAIEGGSLIGLGWLLYHRLKRKALRR